MSIFGTSYSKFISGVDTVLMPHSKLRPDFYISDEILHQSILTGAREWVRSNVYQQFVVLIHLFKEGDPSAKFSEIFAYNNTGVVFYPHVTGDPIQNDAGDDVSFYITVRGYYLDQVGTYDICEVTFRPLGYSSGESILLDALLAEDGQVLRAEDGSALFTE